MTNESELLTTGCTPCLLAAPEDGRNDQTIAQPNRALHDE